jgi:2,5-dihydroxypyridine 5,6-dioxygenase
MNNDTDSDEPQCPFRERGIGERRFMLQEIIEPAWLDAFEAVLRRCALQKGDTVAILAETQSRPVLMAAGPPGRAAPGRAGVHADAAQRGLPRRATRPASTGASDAIQQIKPVVHALAASTLVVDCTVEGLMHAPELPAILKGARARVIYISNEHPEALARLMPDDATEARVKDHVKRLRATKAMRVTSPPGTDLRISLEGAVAGGNWGFTTRPGTMTHWPGGLALAFPAAGSVNGTLVLARAM